MASLDGVSTDDLRPVLTEAKEKKPTQRVMAAINYLEEDEATLEDVVERYTAGWLSRWLDRLGWLADEPFEKVVYDEHRSVRPSELPDEQHEQFVEALHDSPEEVGLDAPAWSGRLTRHYLTEKFDVGYCERHVRRVVSEGGAVLEDSPAGVLQIRRTSTASVARQPQKSATTRTTNI